MVYISYNLPDFNRLKHLGSLYSFIEIRQDLCNFTTNELDQILEIITFPILTLKGDFEKVKPMIQYVIEKNVNLIDYDVNWGRANFNSLIKQYALTRFNPKFVLSLHIDYEKFEKIDLNVLLIELMEWKTKFIKVVVENVDTEESYLAIKFLLEENSDWISLFFSGKYGRESRIEAFKNGCPLNYAALDDIRINDSQLDFFDYFKLNNKNNE